MRDTKGSRVVVVLLGAVVVPLAVAFTASAASTNSSSTPPAAAPTAVPMVCAGTMGPLGGDLHCAPAGPTIPHSPTTSPSPVMAGSASPTPTPTKTPTATPTSTTPKPTPSPTAAGGKPVKALITGYGAPDNTPPGSSEISNPVLHQSAGGDGSWGNPLTVAVGHTLSGGKDILDWPQGTRWYDPLLKAYFLVEDTCGDGSHPQDGPCHVVDPEAKAEGAVTWLDVWVGGVGQKSRMVLDCEDSITGVRTVILDPPLGLPVIVGDIAGSGGCRI